MEDEDFSSDSSDEDYIPEGNVNVSPWCPLVFI